MGIERELAGRKWLPSREWWVVQNTRQLKVRFYSAELCANSLAVMNLALLHLCHVFMQLSYILATCMLCLQPSSSRGFPTWSCSWSKHWPAVFQESLFIVYSILACRWRRCSSLKRLKSASNSYRTCFFFCSPFGFYFKYASSSKRRMTTIIHCQVISNIIQASLSAW